MLSAPCKRNISVILLGWRADCFTASAPSGPLPGGNRTPSVVSMAAVGELVRSTSGAWIVRPPTRCPRGHALRPGRRWPRVAAS
jgi:hypothetical protein